MKVIDALETLPFAKKISYNNLKEIALHCSLLEYEADDDIYTEDVEFPYIGIIMSGKVDYYLVDEELDIEINMGSYKKYPIGLFNLNNMNDENIVIYAAEKTTILAIRYDRLEMIEERFPSITAFVYKSFIKLQTQIIKRIGFLLIRSDIKE
ncbi:hypothetical protein [Sulfurimonas sp.]